MARTSKIASNPVIAQAVNEALARGATIDAITDMLRTMGHEISRTAVGLETKKLRAMADRARDIRAAADAFASKFGDLGDNQTRLMIQLITTIITEKLFDLPSGDEGATPLELQRLASAVKDAISAQKIDANERSRIRKEAHEEARRIAETSFAAAGATDEQLEKLRADFLGLKS